MQEVLFTQDIEKLLRLGRVDEGIYPVGRQMGRMHREFWHMLAGKGEKGKAVEQLAVNCCCCLIWKNRIIGNDKKSICGGSLKLTFQIHIDAVSRATACYM